MIVYIKEFIYKVLELFSSNSGKEVTINGFTLKMPLRYYKYYRDGYEKDNFEFYKKNIKEQDTVIDIGGHLGLNAVAFSQLAHKGKVFVFEPAPNTYKIISKTIALNKLTNAVVFPNAVSDKSEKSVFYMHDSPLADNSNSLVSYINDRKLKKIDIQLISIDDFVATQKLQKVDFIKIDAEGAELSVLKGAEKTLQSFKPKMSLGLHPKPIKLRGDSMEGIYDLLVKQQYNITFEGKPISKAAFCAIEDMFDVQLY